MDSKVEILARFAKRGSDTKLGDAESALIIMNADVRHDASRDVMIDRAVANTDLPDYAREIVFKLRDQQPVEMRDRLLLCETLLALLGEQGSIARANVKTVARKYDTVAAYSYDDEFLENDGVVQFTPYP